MGTVVEAVQDDLDRIAKLDQALATSGLAASALALAARMDDLGSSATSVSMCARALTDVLDRLRELTPEEEKGDGIDDLATRRAQRLSAASG